MLGELWIQSTKAWSLQELVAVASWKETDCMVARNGSKSMSSLHLPAPPKFYLSPSGHAQTNPVGMLRLTLLQEVGFQI